MILKEAFETYSKLLFDSTNQNIDWDIEREKLRGVIYNCDVEAIREGVKYDLESGVFIPVEVIMFAYDRWMYITNFELDAIQGKIDYLKIYLDDYEEEIAKLNKIKSCLENK